MPLLRLAMIVGSAMIAAALTVAVAVRVVPMDTPPSAWAALLPLPLVAWLGWRFLGPRR